MEQQEIDEFKIRGYPDDTECWSRPIQGSGRRRFCAVLEAGPATSLEEEARAAIAYEYPEAEEEQCYP